jgi:hypothetical protein
MQMKSIKSGGLVTLCIIVAISVCVLLWAGFPLGSGSEAGILKGKWFRPDGGYTIDIRSVDPSSGKMEAAYFNPDPIKVAAAHMREENGILSIFIELRDAGYPGCTYRLIYDRQNDQLKGVYYQAAVQESYNIYFLRLSKGN